MSVKLVEITRGPIVECIHAGDIAVVDINGVIQYSAGDPLKITYMRSSAKPIQAMNVVMSGAARHYNLSPSELAVICSSHYAEPYHLDTVKSILKKIGLTKDHILGGTVTSLNPRYALQLAWEHQELSPLFSDCSGKHSGMLTVCRHKNYSIDNYLSPNHPCQLENLKNIGFMCGISPEKIFVGIDGCSAPVHALPIFNMALGFARLANPQNLELIYRTAAETLFDAMVRNPEIIAGTGGFCTELILRTNGKLIGKIGAEGVYCVGIKDSGIGFAIKMESGSMAMLPPVVISVLRHLNVLTAEELDDLSPYETMNNENDLKTIVGKIYPVFELQKNA